MAANKKFRFGPIALTAVYTTNLLNPPTAAGGVNAGASPQVIYLQKIRIVNKTAIAATFRLFLGATGANAAGTEVAGYDHSVGPNSEFELTGNMRIDAADFLVGGAGTALALTIQGEGEIGVAG